jgi:hypothetical protein
VVASPGTPDAARSLSLPRHLRRDQEVAHAKAALVSRQRRRPVRIHRQLGLGIAGNARHVEQQRPVDAALANRAEPDQVWAQRSSRPTRLQLVELAYSASGRAPGGQPLELRALQVGGAHERGRTGRRLWQVASSSRRESRSHPAPGSGRFPAGGAMCPAPRHPRRLRSRASQGTQWPRNGLQALSCELDGDDQLAEVLAGVQLA